MEFLHTSDIHLGKKFDFLGDKAKEHREQLKKTFSGIVDLSIEEKVDLFLIAGDLFDSNHPSQNDIDFVKKEFARLNKENIKVCLIAGNHDFELSRENGLGGEFLDPPNVNVFMNAEGSKIYFEDLNTEVYAKANSTNKSSQSPMIEVETHRNSNRIVMAHGGVVGQAKDPEFPIHPDEIKNSKADYVALGDWHSIREETQGDVTAYYCGSPEMLNISQTGSGYVIFGNLTAGVIEIEKRSVGSRKIDKLELNLSDVESIEEIENKIKDRKDKNALLSVTLSGLNKNKLIFDTLDLEEKLSDDFWRLKIRNKSKFPLEDLNEEDYPSILISGQFVEIMKEKIENSQSDKERHLLEEALQIGLLAFRDPDTIA